MAYFSGANGSMFINGIKAGKVTNWSLNSSLSMLDSTTLGDTDRVSTPGIRSSTGSCTVFYYQETAGSNTGNSASTLIHNLIKGRTSSAEPGVAAESEKVVLKLQINDGSAAGKFTELETYLTSAQMSMGVGEVFAASVNFEVIGAPVQLAL